MTARELVALGTGSQVPSRTRNQNGYLLRWDAEGLLFDPGEGTQRQMLFAGVAVDYFAVPVAPPPGGEVVLRGRLPRSRYMSFNAYDPAGRPTDTMADFAIKRRPVGR